MADDLYAKPDLTKKVRFQTGEREDTNADVSDNADDVRIYDNYWAEESTPPKSQDITPEDQQQSTYLSVCVCLPVSCDLWDTVFNITYYLCPQSLQSV